MIGGKNNFAADRETAAQVLRHSPHAHTAARENRAFLGRAVRYLTAEAGIRQFLDIGTGLPTTNSVHEVAQSVDPSCRVVYADNDPLVLAHARALLTSSRRAGPRTSTPTRATRARSLTTPSSATPSTSASRSASCSWRCCTSSRMRTSQRRSSRPCSTRCRPGQYLTASHLTMEHDTDAAGGGLQAMRGAGISMQKRASDEFARLAFSGLDLVPPGVVLVSEWRPSGAGPRPAPAEVNCYGGVARKR